MDLGSLRALALDLNLSAHGVPATVTRPAPGNTPIETRVIWVTPITDLMPEGMAFQRREQSKVLAIPRDEVPTVPKGTTIVAPGPPGGDTTPYTWKVDGTDRIDADHTRVTVVKDEAA